MYSQVCKLLTICILLINLKGKSQDKIYLNSDVIICKIIDVNSSQIIYLPVKSSKSISVNINKVLFIFNEKGLYLVPSKINFNLLKNKEFIRKFLLAGSPNQPTDYLYQNDNFIIKDKIIKIGKDFINLLNDSMNIDKESISVIIYKNGGHEILGSFTKAADILSAKYDPTDVTDNRIDTVAQKDSEIEREIIPKIENEKNKLNSTTNTTAISEKKLPDNQTEIETKENKQNSYDSVAELSNNQTQIKEPIKSPYDDLPPLRKEEFEKNAMNKAKQLSDYFIIICDKKKNTEDIDKAINQALLLFVNDDATVEVSSLDNETKRYKIMQYLKRLKALNYDKIVIRWTKVQYVTDLKKRPDGNYSGTITFEQEFTGYKDGVQVYSDVTVKKASIILKIYNKNVNGNVVSLWDVLMSDIGVESTRTL